MFKAVVTTIRFYFSSILIRQRSDRRATLVRLHSSTALRPFDDLRHDQAAALWPKYINSSARLRLVTMTLMTFHKQSNGRRIVVVTTALHAAACTIDVKNVHIKIKKDKKKTENVTKIKTQLINLRNCANWTERQVQSGNVQAGALYWPRPVASILGTI